MTAPRKTLSIAGGGTAPPEGGPPASQFAFLTPFVFHDHAAMAERQALADPRGAAVHCRLAVEAMVRWLYDNDAELKWPYQDSLAALTAEPSFMRLVGTPIRSKIDNIRRIGNRAAHPGQFAASQSVSALRELFYAGLWFACRYSQTPPDPGLNFSADALAKGNVPATSAPEVVKLTEAAETAQAALTAERKARMADADSRAALEAELAAAKAEVTALRKSNEAKGIVQDLDEATTRDLKIDLLLREAGWALADTRDMEFPVSPMPNPQNKGWVDYVLWGDDGKPLGLVEAKRTRKDPREGKQQAKLYADALEAMYGQRPVIFYTNGYDHWIWDDARHPPRAVSGFRTKDELALMIQRRTTRKVLASVPTNRAIAGGGGRTYQERAIRAVCHRYEDGEHGGENQRKALLVMATGSGKTRVAIALSDVLMNANWAKRILFLADRVPLVKQATGNYRKYLPDCATVNLVLEPSAEGRVFVSTYPTMMNLIEKSRQAGRQKFGPGFFDLVIIDEAHRSVYRKYKAIFDWFDAPLLGLTATPKGEVDRNTYSLFELEYDPVAKAGVPTDAYELKQAVADGFLVPPRAIDVPLKFPREGIKYDDLSDEEKEAWDEAEWGEDGPPDGVDASAVNDWLFNKNTIDQMLRQLMEDGLKVDGGDRLGKTIVFAKNQKHAEFIVERFDANYPALKGHFCKLIAHGVRYAHSLIDDFEVTGGDPQIAVSVDMLDTGIDIPDVLNLVFFKIVRSKSKFWQMIGRGTRLRPGIFVDANGEVSDKEFFYVFDYLGNLDYFNAQIEGAEASGAKPLGERLFAARVDLLGLMQAEPRRGGGLASPTSGYRGEEEGLYEGVRAQLIREVAGMPPDNFIVRPKRRYVEKFQEKSAWDHLGEEDRHELVEHLAALPTSEVDNDIDAKRFDLLCLRIQLAMLRKSAFEPLRKGFIKQVHALEAKEAVTDVARQMSLILEVQTTEWWTDATPQMVEIARRHLRGLMSLIEPGEQMIVSTDLSDEMGEKREVELLDLGGASSLAQFRKKARAYVDAHADHVTLERLRRGKPLTLFDLDELQRLFVDADIASNADFAHIRALPDLPDFIRSLVGLDRTAAQATFNEALAGKTLSAQQIRFVEMIVDHLTSAGRMEPELLYAPPFTDTAPNGVSDIFGVQDVSRIVETMRSFEPRLERFG